MAYVQPDAAALKLRFPAFAAVDDTVVEYWLTDARLTVTDAWIEQDRAPAEMALAAHNMAMEGYGSAGGAVAGLAAMGVTEFKSGAMSAKFNDATVAARNAGGYRSTRYGVAFLAFLNRNMGGPFLAGGCYFACPSTDPAIPTDALTYDGSPLTYGGTTLTYGA